MRNTKQPFRLTIFTAIGSGNISVPVYDEKKHVGATDKEFVLLSTQSESPDTQQVDNVFITRSSIDIEIIVKAGFEASKDRQDVIEDEIRAILLPVKNTDILTAAGFQMQDIFLESSITRNISITETETILQTVVRITARFVEQIL